ncbi:MAG: AAA family ATPase [Alphaproteobacteria bacterium]|jgi:superfamily I DNA/RNA helicase|nr:AAA family ATPase [Alphaproteobacteria bacterium]
MTSFKVFGPPGTGKTSFLIRQIKFRLTGKLYDTSNKLEDTCTSISADKIGYFSFTKEAIRVAKQKMVEECDVDYSDLEYFRTMHSLGYEAQSFNSETLLTQEDLQACFEKAGYAHVEMTDGELNGKVEIKDPTLHLINYAKSRMMTLQEAFNKRPINEDFNDIKRKNEYIKKHCDLRGKKSFAEMIPITHKAIKNNAFKKIKYLFIDEAQDLSTRQFEFIKIMASLCDLEQLWIAGDDDQAIYSFNGADVKKFIEFKCNEKIILDQSFRVPKKGHEYLEEICHKIKFRESKIYKYRDGDEGKFNRDFYSEDITQYLTQIAQSDRSFLFTARNNYLLTSIKDDLKDNHIEYRSKDYLPPIYEFKEAVIQLKLIQANDKIPIGDYLNVLKRIEAKTKLDKNPGGIKNYGHQKEIEDRIKIEPDARIGLEEMKANMRFMKPWDQMFNLLEPVDISILKQHEKNNTLDKKPNITVDTFHGVKGSEYDNVFAYKQVTRVQEDCMNSNVDMRASDDEWRAYYVGCSRHKKSLTIIPHPNSRGCQYNI